MSEHLNVFWEIIDGDTLHISVFMIILIRWKLPWMDGSWNVDLDRTHPLLGQRIPMNVWTAACHHPDCTWLISHPTSIAMAGQWKNANIGSSACHLQASSQCRVIYCQPALKMILSILTTDSVGGLQPTAQVSKIWVFCQRSKHAENNVAAAFLFAAVWECWEEDVIVSRDEQDFRKN